MTQKSELSKSIGMFQGASMAVAAVVSVSILALPAITADEAGPAAIVSWIVMSLLAVPIVICIGSLATKAPTAGGILDYVSRAFGTKIGAALGITFLGTIPIGMPLVSLIGARYAVTAAGIPQSYALWLAITSSIVAVGLNLRGIRFASVVQSALLIIVLALMIVTVLASLPLVSLENMKPFEPFGWSTVISATVPIFFSFVGWEMVAPIAEEFENPGRDIKRSLLLAVVVVGILYVSFTFITISTNSYQLGEPVDAFALLSRETMGSIGLYVNATLACIVTYGALHVNIAGFSRMLYSQSRNGLLPAALKNVSPETQVPNNALWATLVLFGLTYGGVWLLEPSIGQLVRWPATVFIFAYILTTLAGLRLLSDSPIGFISSAFGLLFCVIAFVSSGYLILFPIALFGIGFVLHSSIGNPSKN